LTNDNNNNFTADACIEEAWFYGCDIAMYGEEDWECWCQYGDDETVVAGTGYESCFLDEYRDYSLAWFGHFFATVGIAVVILCIGGPCICLICFCVGVYYCCCRSNNSQQPAPAQQPTQIIMVPDQRQPMQQVQMIPQQQVQMVGQPGNAIPNYSYTQS